MSNELEPCPFCGGEAELRDPHGPFSRLAAVFCNECEIRGSLQATAEQAITAWNTRAIQQDTAAGEVERLTPIQFLDCTARQMARDEGYTDDVAVLHRAAHILEARAALSQEPSHE